MRIGQTEWRRLTSVLALLDPHEGWHVVVRTDDHLNCLRQRQTIDECEGEEVILYTGELAGNAEGTLTQAQLVWKICISFCPILSRLFTNTARLKSFTPQSVLLMNSCKMRTSTYSQIIYTLCVQNRPLCRPRYSRRATL